MKKIIGNRGCGKTTSLILYANEVCIKHIACAAASIPRNIELAHNLGVEGIKFIPYENIRGLTEDFLIDDIEKYLSGFNKKLMGFTVSNDD